MVEGPQSGKGKRSKSTQSPRYNSHNQRLSAALLRKTRSQHVAKRTQIAETQQEQNRVESSRIVLVANENNTFTRRREDSLDSEDRYKFSPSAFTEEANRRDEETYIAMGYTEVVRAGPEENQREKNYTPVGNRSTDEANHVNGNNNNNSNVRNSENVRSPIELRSRRNQLPNPKFYNNDYISYRNGRNDSTDSTSITVENRMEQQQRNGNHSTRDISNNIQRNGLHNGAELGNHQQSQNGERNNTLQEPNVEIRRRQMNFEREDTNRIYMEGVSGNTKLVDITSEKLGVLTALAGSIEEIPKRQEALVLRVFLNVISKVIENPNDSLNWKKFLLLPTIIFGNLRSNYRKNIRERVQLVINEQWDLFTIENFLRRPKYSDRSEDVQKDKKFKKITKLMQHGNYKDAMKLLTRTGKILKPTEATVERLQQQHPDPNPEYDISEEEKNLINNLALGGEHDRINITANFLHTYIRTAARLKRPGIDSLRVEHLHSIMGKDADKSPEQQQFADKLAILLSRVANGDVPEDIIPYFRDSELHNVYKTDVKGRPINFQILYRKIISAALKNIVMNTTEQIFSGLQYAHTTCGTEKIIHAINIAYQTKATYDIYIADGNNAFNESNRKLGLKAVLQYFPRLIPFLRIMYGSNGNLWHYGLETGVHIIKSKQGWQQGDVLATFLYSLTDLELLQQITAKLGQHGFIKGFVDDKNIAANFTQMVEAIQHIKNEGPKTGYTLNMGKGKYLMAKRETNEAAHDHYQQLIDVGISPNVIVMHPDNVQLEEREQQLVKYGARVLGSYIGTDEYITVALNTKLEELRQIKNNLIEIPHMQLRMLLLRKCYAPKILHLLRTIAPTTFEDFIQQFQLFERDIVDSIIIDKEYGEHRGYMQQLHHTHGYYWDQCMLPVNNGGLGINNLKEIQHAAYIAAILDSLQDLTNLYPDLPEQLSNNNSNSGFVKVFQQSVNRISQDDDTKYLTMDTIFAYQRDENGSTIQQQLSQILIKKRIEQFKQGHTDFKQLAWFTGLQNSEAGRWLDASPKYNAFRLNNVYFGVMLRYRLYLPQYNVVIPGIACDCRHHPIIDNRGHHLATFCPKGGHRHHTHDNLKSTIEQLFRWCGQNAIMEETGCFRTDNPNDNTRPDISLAVSNIIEKKLLIDIQVTCPAPTNVANLQRAQVETEGRAATKAANAKRRKYQAKCEQNDVDFCPAIFESAGYINLEFIELIKRIVKYAAQIKKIPHYKILNHFLTTLSVCLQFNLAGAILKHLFDLNGNNIYLHCNSQHMDYRMLMSDSYTHY